MIVLQMRAVRQKRGPGLDLAVLQRPRIGRCKKGARISRCRWPVEIEIANQLEASVRDLLLRAAPSVGDG